MFASPSETGSRLTRNLVPRKSSPSSRGWRSAPRDLASAYASLGMTMVAPSVMVAALFSPSAFYDHQDRFRHSIRASGADADDFDALRPSVAPGGSPGGREDPRRTG